ncbi:MAG: Cell division protein FtsQ [Myxococcaceae bacterium]|nr:Cell division protein FtsQ [Myxococcaceae bacterium]
MARDSQLSARDKSARARASSASLDPNRSSMRRLSGRRNNTPRPSLAPRLVDSSSGPRNRRVLRAAPALPAGPSLTRRMSLLAVALASTSYRAALQVSQLLSARLTRGAEETERVETEGVETPVSPALRRSLQVLGVLLMVACGYGVSRFVQHHLTTAPAFAIDAISVKGLSRLSRDELLHAAGVSLGMNVFARSPDDIHARLLRHPWILSAEVRRELPSRLEIAVRERDPIALLVVEACTQPVAKGEDDAACEEPSSLYLVSADAKMIKRVSGKEPVDLPVLTGITRQRLASDAELSHRVVGEAVSLMQEYRASDLGQKNPIGEIHLEPNDGYSLYVGDDLTYVRLGAPPFAQKLSRMKKVFERLEHEHARAEYVYLDNEQRPDRVAVRLR